MSNRCAKSSKSHDCTSFVSRFGAGIGASDRSDADGARLDTDAEVRSADEGEGGNTGDGCTVKETDLSSGDFTGVTSVALNCSKNFESCAAHGARSEVDGWRDNSMM